MHRALLALLVLLALVAAFVLASWPDDVAGVRAEGSDDSDGAAHRNPALTASRAVRLPGEHPPARAARTSPPRVAPHRGVRGRVASPRVKLEDGESGIDTKAWEATVFALVPSRERRAIDRIGILEERTPMSARGDFEIDLPTGPHLLVIEHRAPDPSGGTVVEAWYARVDVDAAQRVPVDLGSHLFPAATIAGRVLYDDGRPCPRAFTSCSDEWHVPGEGMVRGAEARGEVDREGRFAFSIGSRDASPGVFRVTAFEEGLRASVDGVLPGARVDLVLRRPEGTVETTIAMSWSPGLTVWIIARDAKHSFVAKGGRPGPGGTFEETRHLPKGRYVVEIFRATEGMPIEWASQAFVVEGGAQKRVEVTPVFQPARAVTGRATPGAEVAWLTPATDGSRLVRARVRADADGRFSLKGLPTHDLRVSVEGREIAVPAGPAVEVDLGGS